MSEVESLESRLVFVIVIGAALGASSIFDKCSTSNGYWRLRAQLWEGEQSDVDQAVATVFLKWTIAAAVAAVAASTPVSPAFGAAQPEMVLLCTNLVSGASWRIKINFSAGTVDSSPARISRITVSWRGTDGGNYTLDRQSGELTVIYASSTGGYFIHDRCKPQS